jgi:hypothetical protein
LPPEAGHQLVDPVGAGAGGEGRGRRRKEACPRHASLSRRRDDAEEARARKRERAREACVRCASPQSGSDQADHCSRRTDCTIE